MYNLTNQTIINIKLAALAALASTITGIYVANYSTHAAAILALVTICPVLLIFIAKMGYKLFWYYECGLFLGYSLFGKGFAYIGINPIYVAEIGVVLAIATLFILLLTSNHKNFTVAKSTVILLFTLIFWQVICTVPYLTSHGLDTARDAVVWGYSIFAITTFLVIPKQAINNFAALYEKVIPLYLVWLIVVFALTRLYALDFRLPGSPVPLLYLKPGDVCVHLAGIAAFMLLQVDKPSDKLSLKIWVLWLLWGISLLIYGLANRGGMLSTLLCLLIVVLLKPNIRWDRLFFIGLVALISLYWINPEIQISYHRELSFEQLLTNIQSIFAGTNGDPRAYGTIQWRIDWWSKIIEYTFRGDFFWFGKGYGINLATESNIATTAYENLRSPHNVFMTFLARSGVPGLILWLLFLLNVGGKLFKKYFSGLMREERETKLTIWLLVYWLAFLVNASFDVFLEGPMGGVWFWGLSGLIIVYFSNFKQAYPHQIRVVPE